MLEGLELKNNLWLYWFLEWDHIHVLSCYAPTHPAGKRKSHSLIVCSRPYPLFHQASCVMLGDFNAQSWAKVDWMKMSGGM